MPVETAEPVVASPASTPSVNSQVAGNARIEDDQFDPTGGETSRPQQHPSPSNADAKPVTPSSDPAPSGQSKDDVKLNGDQPPVDEPVDPLLAYYQAQAPQEAKPTDAPVVSPEPGSASAITQAISTIGPDKVKANLVSMGFTEAQAGELINAPVLAGRHGAEIGQLRKENQSMVKGFEVIKPVIEFDEASGQPKGFNGLRLLEFATKQFGPEEVQKQLETVNLKIVPLNWQPDANPQAGATKARAELAAQVAKEFGIDTANLTPEEIRSEIEANVNAKDAYIERLADIKYQTQRQAEVRSQQTEAQRRAEAEQLTGMIGQYEKTIPHFKDLEPVMTEIFTTMFAKGAPTKAQLVPLLRDAAEGRTIGRRLPALITAAEKRGFSRALKKLGIPESEVIDATPSRQTGQIASVKRNPLDFDPTGGADDQSTQ